MAVACVLNDYSRQVKAVCIPRTGSYQRRYGVFLACFFCHVQWLLTVLYVLFHTFAVLSDRVTELNTAQSRAGLRLEAVEATSRQLGE
jgi:hypothetical protein